MGWCQAESKPKTGVEVPSTCNLQQQNALNSFKHSTSYLGEGRAAQGSHSKVARHFSTTTTTTTIIIIIIVNLKIQ